MRIGLNAIGLIPGTIGGAETYFRNLLFHLQNTDHKNSYFLLCDTNNVGQFPLFNPLFKTIEFNFLKPSLLWFFRVALKRTVGYDILTLFLNRLNLDIIHHPFSILNPRGLHIPSVLTFLDMQQEYYPEYFSNKELRFRKKNYRSSCEEATKIIAISAHVKQSLIDIYNIPAEKIDVVYMGAGSEYRQVDDSEQLQRANSKYGLTRPFMYYPAATWPHKNHKKLLSALKLLRDMYNFDGELLLSGLSMQANNEIMREIQRLSLSSAVRTLGYIPSDDLPYIYNLARLIVFPSLFEGFGLPLIEAMACGCPVVCSNATSIPEIVGDSALMFDPFSEKDMADKLWRVWSNKDEAEALKARGFIRIKKYSWEQTARKTTSVFENAFSITQKLNMNNLSDV